MNPTLGGPPHDYGTNAPREKFGGWWTTIALAISAAISLVVAYVGYHLVVAPLVGIWP